jgi:virginiamycin B lyase
LSNVIFNNKKGGVMLNKSSIVLFSLIWVLAPNISISAGLSNLIKIDNWKVSWEGRPRDPFVDSKGNLWFCGQSGNYIGWFNPLTEKFKQYQVPAGTHPHNLIVDDKGFVWYAGNRNGHIGKLDPDSGKIKQFPMPAEVSDPHTMVFDKNNNIWFTAQNSNAVAHLNTTTGKVRFVKAKTKRSRPYGIKLDHNGKPWVVLVGTNKLASIDPETLSIEEFDIPRSDSRPRRLEITNDNNIWYVDYAKGFLGQYNPETKKYTEWPMPAGKDSYPYGTALDSKQRLWIAETGKFPNQLVGFDTKSKKFVGSETVESGGSIRHMYFNERDNTIWFGVDVGFIGRVRILDGSK